MRALTPELEALMPAWITAEGMGWALDELYLAQRSSDLPAPNPAVQ